jgi:coenzyme F420 hydrogenase subunit beta
LTSESADISIGSPSDWNTIIIGTQIGKDLYSALIENDLIESKKIEDVKPGLPLLEKIAKSKRNKCTKHINKKKEKK